MGVLHKNLQAFFLNKFEIHQEYTKCITILLLLFILKGCQSKKVSLLEGQEGTLNFPYPCDSTEVTLQYSHRLPFYRSSDGSLLSLPQVQARRFKVVEKQENNICSLDFEIKNVKRNDEGTYILSVFKDGQIVVDDTYRIWLGINYPPGQASCVKGEDKGGDWVALDCTAPKGNLLGKIECYQHDEKMPSLNDLTETDTTMIQTILIRRAQPVFCCCSILNEYKDRCECNDTALYLADDNMKDPCPTPLPITSPLPVTSPLYRTDTSSQTDHISTTRVVHETKPVEEFKQQSGMVLIVLGSLMAILLAFQIAFFLMILIQIIQIHRMKDMIQKLGKTDQNTKMKGNELRNGTIHQT